MSAVLDMVMKLAKQKAADQKVNTCHVLYGFVQLLCMNEGVLNTLFKSEDEKEELRSVQQVITSYDIDADMMKKGLSLVLYSDIQEGIAKEVHEKDLGDVKANEYLEQLLESNAIFSSTFKTGCTLKDAILLKNRISRKASTEKQGGSDIVKPRQPQEKQTERQPISSSGQKETEMLSTAENRIESLSLSAKDLFYSLKETVIGQDDAIEVFVRGFFKAEMFGGLSNTPDKPKGVFLFAGPPGVGKTLLAEESAKALGRPRLTLNMSDYADGLGARELTGFPAKMGGSPGKLTSFAAKNQKAVIIFDEIEKAHLNVIHLLLQILDAGVVKDGFQDQNVSFKDTMLIFTTNAGKALYEDNRDKNLSHLDPNVIIDALEKEEHPLRYGPLFPAAICSRFTAGNIIIFNHLSAKSLQRIVQKNFDQCKKEIEEGYGWNVIFDKNLPTLFLYHQGANLDARIIASKSSQFIQDEVYEYTRQAVEHLKFENIKRLEFRVKTDHCNPEISALFKQTEMPKAAMFGEVGWAEDAERKGSVFKVTDIASLNQILSENDISFVIIDPEYGGGQIQNGFSIDDRETIGMNAFRSVREKLPEMPVYILEDNNRLRDVDRITFTKQGAAGFIPYSSQNPSVIREEFEKIGSQNYLQTQIRELADKGKHIAFNTAQKAEDENTTAVIEFYDFKIYTALDANAQSVVLDTAEKPNIDFGDIIGAENAKSELRFFINFLKNPKKFVLDGIKPPKGILLYGPPGTGKTMLARAMAGEADATFLAANATDFMNKYVGEGENRIRNLFAVARQYAPSIIFIDEIDAIAKERTGESHIETYLNTLMTEMDGFKFDVKRPVFVLAATNFPLDRSKARGRAVIDPALLRRFDNKIQVDLPNKNEREEFIRRMLKKSGNGQISDVTIKNISDRTTGESLANIQNILNLANRNAGKAGTPLSDEIFLEALEEFYYGEKHQWNSEYYKHVAHHEAGHAYVTYLSGKTPSYVTIVSRGDFGGYMQHAGSEDAPSYSREELLWRIRISLAGRASEIVFYGEKEGINTGVSGDLQTATDLALNMICRYGMVDDSLLSIDADKVLATPYGEEVLKKADSMIREELDKTIRIVTDGKELIEKLAQKLIENNQLIGDQIKAVFDEATE